MDGIIGICEPKTTDVASYTSYNLDFVRDFPRPIYDFPLDFGISSCFPLKNNLLSSVVMAMAG